MERGFARVIADRGPIGTQGHYSGFVETADLVGGAWGGSPFWGQGVLLCRCVAVGERPAGELPIDGVFSPTRSWAERMSTNPGNLYHDWVESPVRGCVRAW